jgi:mRNA interferase RelE/StbE
MRKVTYSRSATHTLRKLPETVADRLRAKIQQFAERPAELANNVKALKGEPGYLRLRVGDWRVIFSENAVVVSVVKIALRGSAYE